MAGSYRGFLASWIGGASKSPGAQAGLRSLVAPWIGGVSAPSAAQAGFPSLLGMWMGGNVGSPEAGVVVTQRGIFRMLGGYNDR